MSAIEYRRLEPVTVYAASGTVPAGGEVPSTIDTILPPLVEALDAAGVDYREPGIFWYEHPEGSDDMRVWVSWVAVGDPVPGDAWQIVELPAVRAAVAVHRGDMAGIRAAWQDLMDAATADGATFSGPAREVYLQSDGPQSTWVTELQQPVA